MNLREILDFCQVDHAGDWQRLPGGGPADRMLSGLVDVAASDEPPALAVLQPNYRAVYKPRPELGLAWGFPAYDSRNEPPAEHDWQPRHWRSVALRYALVLLNGAMVWQVEYGQVNLGAGRDGVIAWPFTQYVGWLAGESPSLGLWVREWERDFARLLNTLEGNTAFDPAGEEAAAEISVVAGHPLVPVQ